MTIDGHVVDSSQMTNEEIREAIISLREELASNSDEEERYEISNAIVELAYEQSIRARDAAKFGDDEDFDDDDLGEDLNEDDLCYDDPDEDADAGGEEIPSAPGPLF